MYNLYRLGRYLMAQPIKNTKVVNAPGVKTAKRRTTKPDPGPTVTVVKIGEARERFPQMVSSLESGSSETYIVGRYGRPEAALVSYRRFEPMLGHGSKKEKLALLIVENLLEDAPQYIKTPAIQEVSGLPEDDLMVLWRLDELPSEDRVAAAVRKRIKHPEVFDRLRQRAQVAHTIAAARSAGLYEMAEDATGRTLDSGGPESE